MANLAPNVVWKTGKTELITELLNLHASHSHNTTELNRRILVIGDFSGKRTRRIFKRKLKELLTCDKVGRIGIVVDADVLVKRVEEFHSCLEFALTAASMDYSIAYRAFDRSSGAQSLTDVFFDKASQKVIYSSSVRGPVDTFPYELFKAIPRITIIQFDSPAWPRPFYCKQDVFAHHLQKIKARILNDPKAGEIAEVRVKLEVLLCDFDGEQTSLLDFLFMYKDWSLTNLERIYLIDSMPAGTTSAPPGAALDAILGSLPFLTGVHYE
ncbi:hypothetical protein CVT24_007658 [Panaeolus cyanescens]|uniref:Uncharacterized protein n=1 Tax=Panaeolus cyanescens TaxID=181874 RepID=A0A409W9S1_9AGAR|nr:hypothetical protein CVT24_007658 [Panaeolus cyanescens]